MEGLERQIWQPVPEPPAGYTIDPVFRDLEFDPVTQPVCSPERRPRFYKYEEPKTRDERAVSLRATGTRRAPILKKLFEKAREECAELGIPF